MEEPSAASHDVQTLYSPDDELQAAAAVAPAAAVMNPDDPVLARTQAVLKKQLLESKLRIEGEVREKTKLLKDAQKHREDTGVDLFNFQQQLARLQMDLEKAQDRHVQLAEQKEAAGVRVSELKGTHEEEHRHVDEERVNADKFQEELDKCAHVCVPPCGVSLCLHCAPVRCSMNAFSATSLQSFALSLG